MNMMLNQRRVPFVSLCKCVQHFVGKNVGVADISAGQSLVSTVSGL